MNDIIFWFLFMMACFGIKACQVILHKINPVKKSRTLALRDALGKFVSRNYKYVETYDGLYICISKGVSSYE